MNYFENYDLESQKQMKEYVRTINMTINNYFWDENKLVFSDSIQLFPEMKRITTIILELT